MVSLPDELETRSEQHLSDSSTPSTPTPASPPQLNHQHNASPPGQSKSTEAPSQQEIDSAPSTTLGTTPTLAAPQESYFANQSGTSGVGPRSPAAKRAPASRSSHGIPTRHGPPPALITQRSYHAEPWRASSVDPPKRPLPSPQQPQSSGRDSSLARRNSVNTDSPTMNGLSTGRRGTATSVSNKHGYEVEDDDDTLRTHNGTERMSTNKSNGVRPSTSQGDDHTYSSNEDLFLHLARAESEAEEVSDSTKQRARRGSQLGLPTSRSARTSTSRPLGARPASSGGEQARDHKSLWARSGQFDAQLSSHYSSPRDRSYAASAHPLDHKQPRYLHSEISSKPSFSSPRFRNSLNREGSPELPASYGRRQSVTGRESSSGITHRKPKMSHISSHHYNSSPTAHLSPSADNGTSPRSLHPESTESTVSTTAPSTVWDELDDLKSRIRKLELTGKLPSSSGAAISAIANGRPRTATTTMTTASLSPKHGRVRDPSPNASTVKDTDTSTVHPLLHSALSKAKSLVDPKAYKALETTTSDALLLAAMTKGDSHDRQLRRKADSLCRSLTELCIALSEEKSYGALPKSTSRPGSRGLQDSNMNHAPHSEDAPQSRATSQEPERSSSRIMSRLEARRASLLASNATADASPTTNSPVDRRKEESSASHQESPYVPSRTSSVVHRRRTADIQSSPTITTNTANNPTTLFNNSRPASRGGGGVADVRPALPTRISFGFGDERPPAISRMSYDKSEQRPSLPTRMSFGSTATDQRAAPASRASREYTSQHPLPASSDFRQRSPSTHSALPSSSARRSYFTTTSSANHSPATPINGTIQPGNRRYLSTEREGQTTPKSADIQRQQRIASLGQYSTSRRLRLVEGEQG
ncbi:MAG: hypothetical protein Q9183_002360 [Haloplaca sp. 2 TL-2023]